MGQQISYLTVIVVHSTMDLMHHNHCQITTIYIVTAEHTLSLLKHSNQDVAQLEHAWCDNILLNASICNTVRLLLYSCLI